MQNRPKVLLVDDRIENIIALEKLFSVLDVDCVRAVSGNEALKLTLENDFAIALVDVQMPDMDGYETVELMRQQSKTEHLPIIFISAIYSEDIHLIKGIETGAVDFITKPANPEMLIGKIRVHLDLYRQKASLQEAYDNLEQIVRERTAKLEASNKKLHIAIQEAASANRAKSDFLSNMSHEIRTPMNAIIGMTDLVLESELTSEQKEHIETVKQSADALLELINSIMDLSKIEAGKMELEERDFNLQIIMDRIIKTISLKAQNKMLDLVCRISPDVPVQLKGDSMRLWQIIMNLTGNAIKFTEKGGITVNVEHETSWQENEEEESQRALLHFYVSDTGIGIPDNKLKSIFESFTQADTSTTRQYGGTGLGLSISKKLITMMGGEIHADSEPDKGSTFHFTARFEIMSDYEKQNDTPGDIGFNNQNSSIKKDNENRKNIQILLVEDNILNQKVAVKTLETEGYSVEVACDGSKAIEALEKQPFDLVLMDIQMPNMDGIEAAMTIRASKDLSFDPEIPIIAVTAHAFKEDRERCLKAGMNSFISKPFRKKDLLNEIEQTLPVRETIS